MYWLERDDLLDERGGTAIIQIARARLEITEGADQIQCMRLSVVRGLGHPTPFFDRDNRPTVTPHVLTSAERQKLREHARA
jgi:hypothetical protein